MSDKVESAAGALASSDLLHGAGAIAGFLNLTAAQVYHLHASAKLPTFKLPGGSTIHAELVRQETYSYQAERGGAFETLSA